MTDATLVPLTFSTTPCQWSWLLLFCTFLPSFPFLLVSEQKQNCMWEKVGSYGEEWVSFSFSLRCTRRFQVYFLVHHSFHSSMNFASNIHEFSSLRMAFDFFIKATLSAGDECSGHSWNWQLWPAKKIRLGISNWVQISSAILLSGLGQVTSIYLHLNFSSVKGVCVSALACVPLSSVVFLTFLCSALYWKSSSCRWQIPRWSGKLASDWVWLQEGVSMR